MGLVTDLEQIGSLHHPPCVNTDCRLNLKPRHIMRLVKKELISRELSDPEKTALLSRKRNKWFGTFQDCLYPMPVGTKPFSRDPSEKPVKKKRRRLIPSAIIGTGNQQTSLPITPVSQSNSPTAAGLEIRDASLQAGPSRIPVGTTHDPASGRYDTRQDHEVHRPTGSKSSRTRTESVIARDIMSGANRGATRTDYACKVEVSPGPHFETTFEQTESPIAASNEDDVDVEGSRDIKPSIESGSPPTQSETPSTGADSYSTQAETPLRRSNTPRAADGEVDLDAERYPDITRVTDHYLISNRDFNRMLSEKTTLQRRVDESERETARLTALLQRSGDEANRKAQEDKTALERELKAAKQEINRQKGLASGWEDDAQKSLAELSAMEGKLEASEARMKAARAAQIKLEEEKAKLTTQNAALEEEVRVANTKADDFANKAKELFGWK
jgi:hypothetical protein